MNSLLSLKRFTGILANINWIPSFFLGHNLLRSYRFTLIISTLSKGPLFAGFCVCNCICNCNMCYRCYGVSMKAGANPICDARANLMDMCRMRDCGSVWERHHANSYIFTLLEPALPSKMATLFGPTKVQHSMSMSSYGVRASLRKGVHVSPTRSLAYTSRPTYPECASSICRSSSTAMPHGRRPGDSIRACSCRPLAVSMYSRKVLSKLRMEKRDARSGRCASAEF